MLGCINVERINSKDLFMLINTGFDFLIESNQD